jgi:hypothetical protein
MNSKSQIKIQQEITQFLLLSKNKQKPTEKTVIKYESEKYLGHKIKTALRKADKFHQPPKTNKVSLPSAR